MNHLSQQLSNLSLLQTQQTLLEQQKTLHMTDLIQAFDDPSIKKLQEYNKNKMERELLQIADNFHSMMDKLSFIQLFFKDYKTTLESYKNEQEQLSKQQLTKQMEEENDRKPLNNNNHNNNHSNKDQQMIDESLENAIPSIFQQLTMNSKQKTQSSYTKPQQMQQLNQQQQQPQANPKPLVVLPAKRLQTKKQQIQSVINKLKVMVVKVNTKQSSSFEHVYSTYVSRLKYTLEHSGLKEKQFKISITKIMLNYLRKKYVFIKIQPPKDQGQNQPNQTAKFKAKNIYPHHPMNYLEQLVYLNESPLFFINFFVQQLLFFNYEPLRFIEGFSSLLYCPIILARIKAQQSLKISEWYYHQLTLFEPRWRSTILLVKVFNLQTSVRHPAYYSCISLKKFQFENDLKDQLDQIHSHFPFMEHTHHNEEQLLSDLETIKQFIYQWLIFNHLKKVLNRQPCGGRQVNKVHIDIEGGFRVEFELVADLEVKETLKSILNPRRHQSQKKPSLTNIFNLPQPTNESFPQPIYKSQLITDLLLFYKRKNLFTLRRSILKQELQILFKATIFKILTQDIEYRTVTPAYSGSLALYYYEKKTIKKNNVKEFFNNFGEQ